MTIIRSCPWCHEGVHLPADGSPAHCSHCGHRGDVPRLSCDCRQCRRTAALRAIERSGVDNVVKYLTERAIKTMVDAQS